MPTPSRSRQSILIDAVFHNHEKHLVEAFRNRLGELERRQQLAHVSGIRKMALQPASEMNHAARVLGHLACTAECSGP